MASAQEMRITQKQHLISLLKIKRANAGRTIDGLDEELENVVGVMEQEDVAYVEKLLGVKAF